MRLGKIFEDKPADKPKKQRPPKPKPAPKAPSEATNGQRGRGRPPGDAGGKRRKESEYVQASAYIREETRDAVKIALLLEPARIMPDGKKKRRDFSELVEDLLNEWLKKRT